MVKKAAKRPPRALSKMLIDVLQGMTQSVDGRAVLDAVLRDEMRLMSHSSGKLLREIRDHLASKNCAYCQDLMQRMEGKPDPKNPKRRR